MQPGCRSFSRETTE
jgi:hypothetical protein